jgi:hypothetical protein
MHSRLAGQGTVSEQVRPSWAKSGQLGSALCREQPTARKTTDAMTMRAL